MKTIITKILSKEHLSSKEAHTLIHQINEDEVSSEQVAAILLGIQMRGLQIEELKGFRSALLELSIQPTIDASHAIDLCGTGGDGKNTFNISTTTSLVLAAMGYKVVKHGNYGISSMCGSSNVIESLGIPITTDEKILNKQLETTNFCFLHAPLFHPTMKKIAPIRKRLAIPTLFNAMGPLVNPVQPRFQVTGTFHLELAKLYQHVLREERENYKVVYGLDGYDELTLTDRTRILGKHSDRTVDVKNYALNESIPPSKIQGGTSIQEAATILTDILKGQGSYEQTNVIAANVAEAMHCVNDSLALQECFYEAQYFIRSGQPAKHFKLN